MPAAAKNTTASVIRTFNGSGVTPWAQVSSGVDNTVFLKMTYRIPAVSASQYVRLRGTNLPPSVQFETDGNGNPLPDVWTNATTTNTTTAPFDRGSLRIPRTAVGTNVPSDTVTYTAGMPPIDGCPNHLPVIDGVRYVAYDVAAWADLWFYSNPIYIQVTNSTAVAGVN